MDVLTPATRYAPPGPNRRRRTLWSDLTAPQLFAGSFLVLAILGTLGLRLLPGLYTGEPLGWLDALFTAVSAVCVTGLIVVDTATYFTPTGQAFLLLLVQLGGWGSSPSPRSSSSPWDGASPCATSRRPEARRRSRPTWTPAA